jgi:beta-phosphoglucomutase
LTIQQKPTAFLFDLNGTMINDMHYHIKAWHDLLNEFGANISMERMKEECYGKNEELLERILPGRFSGEEKKIMSFKKENEYQREYRPGLKLINGLHGFLKKTKEHNIKMAIGSAAIMFNIDFVLDGLNIRPYFNALVSADDVSFSKPNPETYLKCAARLDEDANNCIVFEDSPKGVEAAANAGMRSVVLTTMHARLEFSQFADIICFVADYTDEQLNVLFGK